jgi:hypothetical protein
VIFGGWVHPKGGGAQIRIAWTSQEILNALYGKGYTILTEDGDYMADSWRQFTFNVPKSNLTLEVYLRQVGNKIWMRVGPSEPPAGVPLAKVEKIKAENLRALNTLRGKFRNRLTARLHGNWEAPYNRPKHTVGV